MVAVLLIIVVGVAAASFVLLGAASPSPPCDAQLASEIGASAAGLCLQPLRVTQNSNSSEFYVPVLIIPPGASGEIDILYHLSTAVYVSHPGLRPNLTASNVPLALSVSSAATNASRVGFSVDSALFQNSDWVIYRYTVKTSADSAGYYAILPHYYWGMHPALAVGASPQSLNVTSLAMWGYTQCCISGEVTMDSSIVGATGFAVVNMTIPGIPYCPNAACNLVARSLY